MLFVALTGLGVAGNYFALPMFFSIEFVFGSVFSLLALQLLGARLGVASALVVSSVTLATWNHPYAMVVFTAEAIVVALFQGRKQVSFVVADAIYWCVVGMPLVFLFYYYVMELPPVNANVTLLKDAVNGLANALIARLVFIGIAYNRRHEALPLREVIANFMFMMALIPSLLFIIAHSRGDHEKLTLSIRESLQVTGQRTGANLEEWLQVRMRTPVHLAKRAASQSLPYMQGALERVQAKESDFLQLALVDKNATIVAHSQRLAPLGQNNIGWNFGDQPYLALLKQSLTPLLSEMLLSGTSQPVPMLAMLAPVVTNGFYAGHVLGVLNLAHLEKFVALNSRSTLSAELTYTLLDRGGAIILSNEAKQKIMQPYVHDRGELIQLGDGLMQWLPEIPERTSVSARWNEAVYIHEAGVGGTSGWKLVLAVPAQPFALQQYAEYSRLLSLLGVALLLGLLLAEWLSRRIVASLNELGLITQKMGQDLLAKMSISWDGGTGTGTGTGTILEIQLLRNDAEDVAATLKAKVEEISQFKLFLESEVARRTGELRESDHFAQLTLDALTSSIAILDENGTILSVNKPWRQVASANSAESGCVSAFVGVNYLAVCDAVTGSDAEAAAAIAASIRSHLGGERNEVVQEYPCDFPAETRWFSCRMTSFGIGGVVRVVVAHEEITERKRVDAELRKLSRAVVQSASAVMITDLAGKIEYVNPQFEKNSGYTSAEVLGINPRILKSGKTPTETYGEMWQLIRAGKEWHGEMINRRKDGTLFWERAAISGLKDENGNVTHYVGVKEDITALKTFEMQLLEINAELSVAKETAEAANVAKSHFLAIMSHEIRTPMNSILGLAQVLQMPNISATDRLDYAHAILGSGTVLLKLLDDILDLSKVDSGKVELEAIAMSPGQIIEGALGLHTEIARHKGLCVEGAWLGSPQHYLGDPHRLRQMLSNLLSNAIKFTAQGQIRIAAREVACDEQSAVLEFSVTDSGIGIAAHQQSLLFQPFSQADSSITRRYGGSGLGLFIVDSLARLMGGGAGVDSEAGHGARFWFRVRVGRVAADSKPAQLSSVAGAFSGHLATQFSGRVLVVEDNPGSQKVIEIMLRKLGLSTLLAEDGQQALDVLAQGETADLILMDVQMPHLDGYGTTTAIRHWEQTTGAPKRPIIALTANAFEEDRQRCLAVGMDAVLTKPLALKALQSQLAKWLPAVAVQASAAPAVTDKPVDVWRVAALVDELLPLLAQHKFNAIGRFRDLQEAAAGTRVAAEINEVGRLLGELQFELALEHLRRFAIIHEGNKTQ